MLSSSFLNRILKQDFSSIVHKIEFQEAILKISYQHFTFTAHDQPFPSIRAAHSAAHCEEYHTDTVIRCGANRIPIDVMDNHAVANLTIGVSIVASVHLVTSEFVNVHLITQ
jgi:hypothetical protein